MKPQFWCSPQKKSLSLKSDFDFDGARYDGLFFNSGYTEAQKNQLIQIIKSNFDYGNTNQFEIDVTLQTLNPDFSYEVLTVQTKGYQLLKLLVKPYLDEELTADDLVMMNQAAQADYGQKVFPVRTLDHIKYLTTFIDYPYLFGVNQLPTIVDRAIYLWTNIGRYQSFGNGNKRTALMAMLTCLYKNFYVFPDEPEIAEELYQFSKGIAVGTIGDKELKEFILSHLILNLAATNNDCWNETPIQLEDSKNHIFKNVVKESENENIYQVLRQLAME